MNNKGISEEELRRKHSEDLKELHRQLEEKDKILENYKKEHGELEVFLQKVINKVSPVEPLQQVKVQHPAKTESQIEPVVQISDSHMGEVQEPDEIEGFNEFNPDICRGRNMGFTRATLQWIQLHRHLYKIKNLNLVLSW